MASISIMVIMIGASLPAITKTWHSYHLSSATSSITGAIQSARYMAIKSGCIYHFTVSGTEYQVKEQNTDVSGSCTISDSAAPAPTYSYAAPYTGPVPFSQGDVSVNTAVTLTLFPNGTVSTASSTCPINLDCSYIVVGITAPGESASRTINVSGVGYVTIS